MRRLTSAALLCCLALSTAAFAQSAKSAASTAKKDVAPAVAAAPPSPEVLKARMRPPVKGTAFVEFITVSSKAVKDEIVTQLKIKNTSNAPIVGMKVDQYFYAGKQEVSAGTGRLRNPMAPGEIADITVASPMKPGITGNQMMFSHANGQVKPTSVKKFTDEAAAKKK
jgi:hypothetical protein